MFVQRPAGNTTSYAYDGQGRLTTITDPVGLATTFAYSGDHLASVTDPARRWPGLVLGSPRQSDLKGRPWR